MRDSSSQNHEQLIDHPDIVQDYLDALLQEASLSATLADSTPVPTLAPIVKAPRTAAAVREIPEWGRQGFAALLFEVAGIKMAAPLHALGGICLLENKLQSVAAQADWFMGILRWNDHNLRVIDTARFVMPERVNDNSHRARYQSVIVLGDSHWALAVDQANESTHLASHDVRWKHLLGTRPWLAGTLLNKLYALVDLDCLAVLLDDADYASPRSREKH